MVARWLWLGIWLGVVAGCQSMVALELPEETPAARELWEQGQAAMRQGQPAHAITFYQQSLSLDPKFSRNHLSLAAAYLEMGETAAARPHLQQFVTANPTHLAARGYLAELYLRLERLDLAREQFERFVALAQEQPDAEAGAQLIRCHRRLMEIAQVCDDTYGEHLNRGIGLFLLARARAGLPDPEGLLPTEGLLCKAAGELTLARLERPDEARPCWYLYEVWSQLPARQPAVQCLHDAQEAAPFTYLTPAEHRSLQLAIQCNDLEHMSK